ncbi:MAG TPA: nitrite/sulfite reductase [Dehalococcoidia bacterium]|nr:nitrite/sulfite reductase [Chloroflexota bacterium]HIM59979.1 nitrite/sulfite reductase [Dehalococcoidia bacterium]
MTTKSVSTSDWIPNPENASVLKVDGSEIANFEDQVKLFQAGEKDEIEFLRFRLRQGVYGQRQPDRQMIRVKIPFGGLTADQMDVLGEVAEIYTPLKKGHFTTRENVQYHHVPLAETPELLRLLGDSGLSTREACGNTVRNVVAHPSAGVSKDEVFDVTPYAAAYSRYFLRHPTTQNMPRKSKVAFSGSEKDEAMVLMHDVGLVARIRDGKRGFKIVVGGGLSTKAIMAKTLSEFVPVEDYLLHCEAVLRIFNRQDEERKSIAKARIKFTIDRLGIDKFKEMVDEELLGDWAKKQIDTDSLMFIDDEESDAPGAPTDATPEPADGQADHAAYSEWKRTSVVEQRQDGFSIVYVRVERGDVYANQWSQLASIARTFAGARARIDQQQNLVYRWVRTESLFDIYKALGAIGFSVAGRETIRDIVTCPGTDSCKLGITSSMGLNKALGEAIDKMGALDPLVENMHIKASGCPNSCGQHHLASIGFHGAVVKGPGGQVPAYELFLGGRSTEAGGTKIGTRVKGRVPAKRAPEALKMVIDTFVANRKEGEEFAEFIERFGVEHFEKEFTKLKQEVGPLDRDHIQTYMDWGKTVVYKLERGEGECAV